MTMFEAGGDWYKGNLHTHTTNSDGALPPSEMIEKYRESGCDFLSLTDHEVLTIAEGDGDLLLIPGEEIGCESADGCFWHILGIDIKAQITDRPGLGPQGIIDAVNRQHGLAIIAHPYWSCIGAQELLALEGYLGIEVFNTSCHYSVAKGYSTVIWDLLLCRGKNLFGFATDDAHYHSDALRPVDICGACIMVKAEALTRESILGSIRKGWFYASSGPEIRNVRVLDERIVVETSRVKKINVIGNGPKGKSYTAPPGETLEGIEHLRRDEAYIRIECCDDNDKWAWTNCVYYGG